LSTDDTSTASPYSTRGEGQSEPVVRVEVAEIRLLYTCRSIKCNTQNKVTPMTNLIILLATTFSLGVAGAPFQSGDLGSHIDNNPVNPVLHAVSGEAGLTGTRAEISWTGSGFLCLKSGNTCQVVIGIGLNVSADPGTYGMPVGSTLGLLESVDNAPVPSGPSLSLGEQNVEEDQITVIEGTPLPPGSTIFIPEQETVFDPVVGHLFYYFGG
jgi:hypothetical protein